MNARTTAEEKKVHDSQVYPGIAVNDADDERDTRKLQKERTCTLNNNPRNEAINDQ